VADALDTAHRAQLVHRDVKPSNLVVAPDGQVTLLDFGISRMLDADSEITRTGEIVGTIAYCSPEQLSRGRVGPAADQYSLACVAYEGLTGEVPFPREGQLAIMTAHLTAAPPRASALAAVPPGVDAVLHRALAKDPAARFPTCTDFVDALAAAVRGEGAGRHPDLPDPEGLEPGVRVPGDPYFLALRLGRGVNGPLVARPLADGPLVVRAEPAEAAGLVRWLLAQAVARHAARDLCLAVVLAPTPDETWLWVNWLPHARPTTPPLSGPHVATTPEAAVDLLTRLGALMAGGGGPVLAVIDSRLATLDLPGLAAASRAGIHVVALLAPGTPTPYGMSTVDIIGGVIRHGVAGQPPVQGEMETVPTAYLRALADRLPDG
jgi:hypothetical protein